MSIYDKFFDKLKELGKKYGYSTLVDNISIEITKSGCKKIVYIPDHITIMVDDSNILTNSHDIENTAVRTFVNFVSYSELKKTGFGFLSDIVSGQVKGSFYIADLPKNNIPLVVNLFENCGLVEQYKYPHEEPKANEYVIHRAMIYRDFIKEDVKNDELLSMLFDKIIPVGVLLRG